MCAAGSPYLCLAECWGEVSQRDHIWTAHRLQHVKWSIKLSAQLAAAASQAACWRNAPLTRVHAAAGEDSVCAACRRGSRLTDGRHAQASLLLLDAARPQH